MLPFCMLVMQQVYGCSKNDLGGSVTIAGLVSQMISIDLTFGSQLLTLLFSDALNDLMALYGYFEKFSLELFRCM